MGGTALEMNPPWSTSFLPGTRAQIYANWKRGAYEQGSVSFMQSSPGLQGAPHSLSSFTRVSGPGTEGSGLSLCDRVSTTCPVSHLSEPCFT